jgi:hypothetical protein
VASRKNVRAGTIPPIRLAGAFDPRTDMTIEFSIQDRIRKTGPVCNSHALLGDGGVF